MGEARVPPHNLDAEEAVLGACLLVAAQVEACAEVIVAGDFYKPAFGHIWDALVRTWASGSTPDPVAVAETLRRGQLLDDVGGSKELMRLVAHAPATSTAVDKAKIVAELAGVRRLIAFGGEMVEAAYAQSLGSYEMVDWAHSRLDGIEFGGGSVPASFQLLDDFLERPADQHKPWIIPGQLRQGWRSVFVAGEGVGKSVLLRQAAIMVSQGLHPFVPIQRVTPVRALVIDLENPDEAIDEQANLILNPLWQEVAKKDDLDWDGSRIALLHEESGLNFRSRRDRAMIEAVLSEFKPQLVVAGPAYKMYELDGDKHEVAVHEVQRLWDKWRTRYGFALMIEHHAPMGGDRGRQIRPADTMRWLQWPEFGVSLSKSKKKDDPEGTYNWGRYRGDRVKATWPVSMTMGKPGTWPWEFRWPDGTFTADGKSLRGHGPEEEPF